MHEGSVTSQIVDCVLKEAEKRKAKQIVEVHLVIGKLTFLNPEQVRFWYEMLTKGTIMEKSKLIIEESEGVVKCSNCDYEGDFQCIDDPAFHINIPTLSCPRCGGVVEIVGGKDCLIKRVKLLV